MNDDLFPARLYVYDADGRYASPVWIENEAQLFGEKICTLVSDAMRSGVEVRITDTGDCLVFHAKGGKILFPDVRMWGDARKES